MTGPVRSVSLAFAILRLLADEPPLTLSAIGARLGLSPSSCLNLVRTLVHEGAVEQVMPGKRYRLATGWKTFLGDGPGDDGAGLIERAGPAMARLAAQAGATIGLWRIVQGKRLQLVHHVQGGHDMAIQMQEGQRQPLGGGATGRALGAAQGLSRADLAGRFGEVRWQVPLTFVDYCHQVDAALSVGYAIDNGHGHAGICSLGAALRGARSDFCLSASIFAGSRDAADIARLGNALKHLAEKLGDPR